MSNPVPIPFQLSPLIAIYEDETDFTIRTSDSALAKLISPAVIKLLDGRARKLTLITPTDTKVFKLASGAPLAPSAHSAPSAPAPDHPGQTAPPPNVPAPPLPASARISQDLSAPPAPELADEHLAELARQREEEAAQAEQQQLNSQSPDLPADSPSAPRKRSHERPKPAALPTACGRCLGSGALEGGGACPVCHGKGSVAHWGRARR